VIDENASKLIANRLVDQYGCNGRIDAAGQTADHLFVANLRADRGNRLFAVSAHGPVAGEACEFDEVLIQLCAVWRVVHLGVELHRIEIARHVGRDGEGRVGRCAVDLEAGCDGRDVVAVAHPDLLFFIGKPAA